MHLCMMCVFSPRVLLQVYSDFHCVTEKVMEYAELCDMHSGKLWSGEESHCRRKTPTTGLHRCVLGLRFALCNGNPEEPRTLIRHLHFASRCSQH